jgi:hypothetical protein
LTGISRHRSRSETNSEVNCGKNDEGEQNKGSEKIVGN